MLGAERLVASTTLSWSLALRAAIDFGAATRQESFKYVVQIDVNNTNVG